MDKLQKLDPGKPEMTLPRALYRSLREFWGVLDVMCSLPLLREPFGRHATQGPVRPEIVVPQPPLLRAHLPVLPEARYPGRSLVPGSGATSPMAQEQRLVAAHLGVQGAIQTQQLTVMILVDIRDSSLYRTHTCHAPRSH